MDKPNEFVVDIDGGDGASGELIQSKVLVSTSSYTQATTFFNFFNDLKAMPSRSMQNSRLNSHMNTVQKFNFRICQWKC